VKYLSNLTWDEAEAALRRVPVMVIPLGAGAKEHGLHLPLNNDELLADYFAARLAETADVLIAPTVRYGYYPSFVEYPGSVNIALETCRDFIADICRSFARHGATRLYVLNTGISTCRALEPARLRLQEENILMEFTRLDEAHQKIPEGLEQQPGGTHADEIETSMMLYIAPHVVRLERARPDYREAPGRVRLTRDPDAEGVYSPTGAWGDPTLATLEKGRIVVETLVRHISDEVNAFARLHCAPRAPDPRWT